MKKLLFSILTLAVFFTGCAKKDGLAVNTMDQKIDRYYHKGEIVKQRKVIIDDNLATSVTNIGGGAVAGALGGLAVANNKKGVLLGSFIGAVAGAVKNSMSDNEIEAYETSIMSNGHVYTGYLKDRLRNGTFVEFTVHKGQLKNVSITNKKDIYVEGSTVYQPNSKNLDDKIIRQK